MTKLRLKESQVDIEMSMNDENNMIYRAFDYDDDEKIQTFLQNAYALNGVGYSWMIDRWNFTRSVSRCMYGLTVDEWNDRVLILEERGHVIAVVNSEGENKGEAFFQLIRNKYSQENIGRMFDFAEDKLMVEEEDAKSGKLIRKIELRLNPSIPGFVEEALQRGYRKMDWQEPTAEMKVIEETQLKYDLPKGYRFLSGNKLSGKEKAVLHRMAFAYDDPSRVLEKRTAIGFKTMEIQPFYNAFLDIIILNDKDQAVCFANFWFDPINKIAILEPLGTHQAFRKMGLAKAAVYEGIKRSMALGAEKIYVGSDQDFYKAIGFEVVSRYDIYTKIES